MPSPIAKVPAIETCGDDTSYYTCSDGLYEGCCSHDPCAQGTCYDQPLDEPVRTTWIERRNADTTTVTKILVRDSGSESSPSVVTITSTVTLTSTVVNNVTVTSLYNTAAIPSSTSIAKAAASKTASGPVLSISKPSATAQIAQSTKTSTHTSATVTTTKALVFTSNKNSTSPSKKADLPNAGHVAGITLGSIAGAVMIGLLIFLCCRRRKSSCHANKKTNANGSIPSTPVVEAGGKRKFTFGGKGDSLHSSNKTLSQHREEQLQHVGGTSRKSQPEQSIGFDDILQHISSDRKDEHSASHAQNNNISPEANFQPGGTNPNPTTNPFSTESHQDVNLYQNAPIKQYAYMPFSFTKASSATPITGTRSPNDSILQTPTNMIGSMPEANSKTTNQPPPTSSRYPMDQTAPGYLLPSQRPNRQTTPSVWTDAEVPPSAGMPPPLPSTTTTTTTTDPSRPSFMAFKAHQPPQSATPAATTTTVAKSKSPRKKVTMQIATSGTTTESDVASPRHEGQEPARRRKSLFQSPGGVDGDEDEVKARLSSNQWI